MDKKDRVIILLVFLIVIGVLTWLTLNLIERSEILQQESYTNGTEVGVVTTFEFIGLQAVQCNANGILIPFRNQTLILFWEGCFQNG